MRKFLLSTIIFCIIIAGNISAQGFESGAFGAPVLKFTKLINHSALMVGGRGGWIINQRFVIGAGIYALTSNIEIPITYGHSSQSATINFNYGGLEFEFLLLQQSKFNISMAMLCAGGGVEFYYNNKGTASSFSSSIDLLVWEPQLNFEVELYKWLHADAGASYRIISSYTEANNITKDDLQGASFQLTFKFGAY